MGIGFQGMGERQGLELVTALSHIKNMQTSNYLNIILEDNKSNINSVNTEGLDILGETDLI